MTIARDATQPLRVVQAGMGGWGRGWMEILNAVSGVEAVALVDPSPSAREAITSLGVSRSAVFATLGEAISARNPDAALVTSGVEAHAGIALEALSADLHVLVEKPFASTVEEAVEVVDAAERTGRIVMISQNYRHHPAPRQVARLVADGAIGDVSGIEIDFRRPRFRRREWLEAHQRVPQPLLADMSIHHFDLLRLVLDREPLWVEIEPLTTDWGGYRDPPAAFGLLGFEGGVIVSYRGSWISGGRRTPWGGEWRMDGTNGAIEWASRGDQGVHDRVILRPAGDRALRIDLPTIGEIDRAGSLAAFAEAVATGREPETSGRRNLGTLALTYAAVRSATEHRRVDVAELLDGRERVNR
ncbi:MAG TPA: Gfo/Idh/MocA family oxidoreductase [Candidatus Limnocylindrales bacterium]|nr:Gfo/Idh/MocA family oxidoreductase [Candidatus Limnocylindrales bacterium]